MKLPLACIVLASCMPAAHAAQASYGLDGDPALSYVDLTPGDSFVAGVSEVFCGYCRTVEVFDGPVSRGPVGCPSGLDCTGSTITGGAAFDRWTSIFTAAEYDVAPFTQVTVTLAASVFASIDAPNESAGASVDLRGSYFYLDDQAPGAFLDDGFTAFALGPGIPDTQQRTLSITFSNATDQVARFQHGYTAGYNISRTVTAPVPEPQTYALWLAGVAALGWRTNALRRRLRPST